MFYNEKHALSFDGENALKSIFTVKPENTGTRLDQLVAECAGITRSQAQKLIEKGMVSVSGQETKKNYRVREGDRVSYEQIPEEELSLIPHEFPLKIMYEDDHLIVINKPYDLVMYPAAGHAKNTLMNAVAFHCPKLAAIGGPLRPGVVHRLDKDTSGLVVVALDDETYYSLQEQFKSRTIERSYLTLVYGRLRKTSGTIDMPIGRAHLDRKKMSTRTRGGKSAITHYTALEQFRTAALLQARLATGRTHQIRVHFASIGHPVLGDKTYGGKTSLMTGGRSLKIPRQMLHAHTLGFVHPITGKAMEFSAPLPEDMKFVLEVLRQEA